VFLNLPPGGYTFYSLVQAREITPTELGIYIALTLAKVTKSTLINRTLAGYRSAFVYKSIT